MAFVEAECSEGLGGEEVRVGGESSNRFVWRPNDDSIIDVGNSNGVGGGEKSIAVDSFEHRLQ